MAKDITVKDILRELATGVVAEFAGAKVRPMTLALIWNLLMDLPLTPAQSNDFGVATRDHYRALNAVIHAEHPLGLRGFGEELDRAMGNGPALTKLVQTYAPQYKALRFATPWDELSL